MQLHRTQCARERNRGFFRPASAISVSRQQSVQGWQQKIPTTERWFQQAQLVQRAIGCIPAQVKNRRYYFWTRVDCPALCLVNSGQRIQRRRNLNGTGIGTKTVEDRKSTRLNSSH